VATDIEPEAGMKNTRTIKVGERIAVSYNGRGAFEGIITENNLASALIYVEGQPYERREVLGRHGWSAMIAECGCAAESAQDVGSCALCAC
jgi:hypothetical protein